MSCPSSVSNPKNTAESNNLDIPTITINEAVITPEMNHPGNPVPSCALGRSGTWTPPSKHW